MSPSHIAALAVFGNPVSHSRSPEIQRAFAAQSGIALSYEKIEAPLDGFADVVRRFVEAGAHGFNVTVPFKREAFELADDLDDSARQSETVNTVRVVDGRLLGSNTDGAGLVVDLESNLGWQLEGRRVLLIGAGGAVQGILPALLARLPASIDLLNRTHERAVELAEKFGVRAVTADEAGRAYDVVISGSAAGLAGEEMSLPATLIGRTTRCYDMVYGSAMTAFNAWGRASGAAETADGLGMLVEQAAAAYRIWFGDMPDTRPVIDEMRSRIGETI